MPLKPSPDDAPDIGSVVADEAGTLAAKDLDTGRRLKAIRELHGLSQRELAKRAGITNSSISMIEQGQVSPSVQSLGRILNALPMTLAEFFAWDTLAPSPLIVSRESLYAERLQGAGTSIQRLASGLDQRQLDLQQIELRALSQSHIYTACQSDYCGFLLTGQLQLMSAQGANHYLTQELRTGDGFYIPRGQVFRFGNPLEVGANMVLCSLFVPGV